jgi:hypothetical protein
VTSLREIDNFITRQPEELKKVKLLRGLEIKVE